MLIKHLFFFVTLAKEKHFGRAAQICDVAQPSLSYAIQKLEKEFGVQLVERGHEYAKLTTEGKKVFNWGKRILRSYDQLRKTLHEVERTELSQ
jgi:DNA-binding transcriptional LysR family regulator